VNLGIGGYYVLAGDINRLLADLDRYCARMPPVAGSTAVPAGEIPSLDGSATRFFLGTSPDAARIRRAVYRLRLSRDPVLVLGESGSGKELVSRMVHENSPVRDGPFIPVNASCLPEALAESQLFGTVRGAFTGAESHSGYFESADGGTLFLDEVAELTPSLQAKLLRVVEDGMITRVGSTGARRVSVRLICASNRDLGEMVDQGMFRTDLYYRLDVLRLRIPPLRNRKEDIPLLAEFRLRERKKQLSLPALDRLRSYYWPGNVRQLFHCLDRAAGITPSDIIYPEHLDF
jgi:transcriptional regulator with PAS, ATPase and Fis domain